MYTKKQIEEAEQEFLIRFYEEGFYYDETYLEYEEGFEDFLSSYYKV